MFIKYLKNTIKYIINFRKETVMLKLLKLKSNQKIKTMNLIKALRHYQGRFKCSQKKFIKIKDQEKTVCLSLHLIRKRNQD